MITVKLCDPCNGAFKLDDEYFRVYVTMGAEPGTRLGQLSDEKVIGSSFARSPRLKSMLAQRRAEFVQQYQGKPVQLIDGTFVPDEARHLLQPLSANRVSDVVWKIVRCLHFHLYKERLPEGAKFIIATAPLHPDDNHMVTQHPTGRVGTAGEFLYLSQALDVGMTRWILSYYDRHTFDVLVTAP